MAPRPLLVVDEGYAFSHPWMRRWLEAFAKHFCVVTACAAVRYSRSHVYACRDSDKDFARAWDDVASCVLELAEASLAERAIFGTKKAVFQGGRLVGYHTEKSDALLRFYLANVSAKWRRYREVPQGETGPGLTEQETASRLRDALAQMSGSVMTTPPAPTDPAPPPAPNAEPTS